MDAAHVGVRTRARAMAMGIVTGERVDGLRAIKRRKLSNKNVRSTFVKTKAHDECEINGNLVIEDKLIDSSNTHSNARSRGAQVACCSSTGSMEKPKDLDLEVESVKTETETDTRDNLEGYKSTPDSDFKEELNEVNSSKAKQLSETNNSSPKMPPAAELEEFFANAQQDLNKRFKNKYNYDIVNDIPLKGRFEWIRLNPENEDKDEDEDNEDKDIR